MEFLSLGKRDIGLLEFSRPSREQGTISPVPELSLVDPCGASQRPQPLRQTPLTTPPPPSLCRY